MEPTPESNRDERMADLEADVNQQEGRANQPDVDRLDVESAPIPEQARVPEELVKVLHTTDAPTNERDTLTGAEQFEVALQERVAEFRGASEADAPEKFREICAHLSDHIVENLRNLSEVVQGAPPVDGQSLRNGSFHEIRQFVAQEEGREQQVSDSIQNISKALSQFSKTAVQSARERYGSVTGFLDNKQINRLGAFVGSLVGTGVGGVVAIGMMHPVLADFSHSLLGSGLGYKASYLGIALADFAVICMGASAGAFAVGGVKAIGGRVLRKFSSKARERFEATEQCAGQVKEGLAEVANESHALLADAGELLAGFYGRNEQIRVAVSDAARSGSLNPDEAKEAEKLINSLGERELIDQLEVPLLERGFASLSDASFLSPELDSEKGTLTRLKDTSIKAGVGAALAQTEGMQYACEKGDNSLLHSLGASFLSVHKMLVQSGVRPDKLMLDTFKSGVGMIGSIGKDQKQGASFLDVVAMTLALEEIRDGKGWKWLGKIGPNAGLFVFKKVYFMLEAEKRAELAGEGTGLRVKASKEQKYIAQQKGFIDETTASVKEIGKEFGSALGGVAKLFTEVPMKIGAAIENRSAIVDAVIPGRISGGLARWYRFRKNRIGLRQLEGSLPNGEELAKTPLQNLQYPVMKALARYHTERNAETSKAVTGLLKYFDARSRSEWLENKARETLHTREVVDQGRAIRPLAAQLHKKQSESIWTSVGRAVVRGADACVNWVPGSKGIQSMVGDFLSKPSGNPATAVVRGIGNMLTYVPRKIRSFAQTEPRQRWEDKLDSLLEKANMGPRKAYAVVLDAHPDGRILYRDHAGKILLGTTSQVRKEMKLVSEKVTRAQRASGVIPIPVLPNADTARIKTIEAMLRMKLEPQQSKVILDVHHKTLAGELTRAQQIDMLAKADLSESQIVGVRQENERSRRAVVKGAFPGLLDSGLVGNCRAA